MMPGATESDDLGLRKRRSGTVHSAQGAEEPGLEYGTMGGMKKALNETLHRKHLQLPSWRERAARFHAAHALPPDENDQPLVIL